MRAPVSSFAFVSRTLELQPEVQLHDPRSPAASQLAEGGRAEVGGKPGEPGHVKGVEHVGPELQVDTLGKAKPLG